MASGSTDLTQAWQDACREFIDATGMDLDIPAPTSEQIILKMDELSEAKEEKSRTAVAKAKTAVGLTLRAVERIGSIMMQGASLTRFGGPSNITFNCISFFIEAGFAYGKIAGNIEDLFNRIVPIMERSQLYKDNQSIIGPEMVRVAHRLLIAVVRICEKCIGILGPPRSKRAKIKLFFEVALFSGDGGVQEQLTILESLQDQEGRIGNALTLVTTKAMSRDMAAGFEEQKAWRSKTEEAEKDVKMLKELTEKLDINEMIAEANYEDHQARKDKVSPESCSWLKEDSQYGAWSDTDKISPPVVIVQGEEGCGKSHTATAIIRDLMTRYPQGREDATRISVGYFYLTCGDQKSGLSMLNVLRQWAGQILQNDLIYRKEVSTMIKQNAELGDFKQLLERLFLKRPGKEARFFLILDGTYELDGSGKKELAALISGLVSQAADGSCPRVVLTMDPTLVTEVAIGSLHGVTVLDLKEKNRADLGRHIAAEASSLAIFKNSSPQVEELKNWVISELSEAARGSFIVANRTLTEVGNCAAEDEVRDTVTRAIDGTVLSVSIEKTIWDCNRTLSPKEIRHLNCLLLWVIFSRWTSFQVYDLESVLFVQEQRKSLQPLHKEMKDKYSAFFDLSDDDEGRKAWVSLKHSSIEEYFRRKSNESKSSGNESSEALSKGEIIMARHFLEKLCDDYVYKRLGLAAFFDQQLSKTDAGVAVDYGNAQAKISLGCMRAATSPRNDENRDLAFYATVNLVGHLGNIDLETVDSQLKTELGPLLVKMFTRDDTSATYPWAQDDEGVEVMVRLLRNSVVRNGITDPEDANWVSGVLDSDQVPPDIGILQKSVGIRERSWLTVENEEAPKDHFIWLFAYYNKIESAAGQTDRMRYPSDEDLTAKVVNDIFERSTGPEKGYDAASEAARLRNLGFTYYELSHIPEAIRELERALALDDDDLLTRNKLANCYAEKIDEKSTEPNWERALYHKDIVIARLAAGRKLDPDTETKEDWKYVSWRKAIWLRQLGRFEESRETLESVLADFPDASDIRRELMRTLHDASSHDQIVNMFQALGQEVDATSNKNRLSLFFYAFSHEQEFHSCIVAAFRLAGTMMGLDGHYRQAIEFASDESERDTRNVFCELTYYHASMLNRLGKTAANKEEAVRLWELVIDKAKLDSSIEFVHVLSAKHLARIYTAKAIQAGRDSPETKEMLDKLRSFSGDAELEDEEKSRFGLSRLIVRSLLGRYFYAVGDFENARKQLRTDVEVGLKLLADDDPENDYQAYRKLGDAFMNSGDDENAKAAWSLIHPIQAAAHVSDEGTPATDEPESAQAEATEVSELPQTDNDEDTVNDTSNSNGSDAASQDVDKGQELRGPILYLCDGGCEYEWTYADNFYVCRECIDIQFGEDCLAKFRSGELVRDVCDPAHDFMHVPKWTAERAERTRQGKVLVGDQEMGIVEWLEGIKQRWGVDVTDTEPLTQVAITVA